MKRNEKLEAEIINLANDSSLTKQQIADTVGVHKSTVFRVLARKDKPINNEPLYLQEAIELYNNGFNCKQIGEKFNVGANTISKWLKQKGVNVKKTNTVNWTIEEVIDAYNNGESLTKMAKRLNSNRNTIARHLKAHGIDVKNKWNETKFNEHIFDNIDTEEKAYWLGFIYADGYISHNENKKDCNRFEIVLKEEDINHLYKFNKFMEYKGDNVTTKVIKTNGKEYKACRWSITNKHLWTTLYNLGCIPRKSLQLKFPDLSIFKQKSLVRHFIRGYFDGDGCISYIDKEHTRPCINVLGTKDVLDKIRDFTIGDTLEHYLKKGDNRFTFEMERGNVKALFIMYTLYYKANIYLNRKYQRFLYFKDCRFKAKALKLLEGKIGEGWDANPELIADLKELQQCNA